MRHSMPLVLLISLLILASIVQGIRLDQQSLVAFHQRLKDKSMLKVGGNYGGDAVVCRDGSHCSDAVKEKGALMTLTVHHKLPGFHEDYYGPRGHKPKHH